MKEFMTYEMALLEERLAGEQRGRIEGRLAGREEGREEGREKNLIENLKAVMNKLNFTAEKAMDFLDVPAEKRSHLFAVLNE